MSLYHNITFTLHVVFKNHLGYITPQYITVYILLRRDNDNTVIKHTKLFTDYLLLE